MSAPTMREFFVVAEPTTLPSGDVRDVEISGPYVSREAADSAAAASRVQFPAARVLLTRCFTWPLSDPVGSGDAAA